MENTGNATEGDPLKRGEDAAETGEPAAAAAALKKKSLKEMLGFSRLTHWRTAFFFISFFVCLIIMFAFSFVIACPVRPQYLLSWNRTFTGAATYNFLAVEAASSDKVLDVLFVIKTKEGSQNNTCSDADPGLPSPCVFVVTVDGTDGETLWELPLHPEFHWAQCGLQKDTSRTWDCLLSHSDQITALDKRTGKVVWHQPQTPGLHSAVPVLSVPDVDGDKVQDVALVASEKTQTRLAFLSGTTGEQIGSTVTLDSAETRQHLLYRSAEGAHYVLLQKESGLYGLALWRIAASAKAGMDANLRRNKQWEKNADATSGLVPIYDIESVEQVVKKEDGNNQANLLLVTGSAVVLVDGGNLKQLWRRNVSAVLSQPSFGHFNKDGVLDVVIEEDTGNHTKRILILDGASGSLLWEVSLLSSPNSPRPASIHTTNVVSVFVFWGAMTSGNDSVPLMEDRRSYMLHPLYSGVLLESTNSLDHIITYKATLLERGRHAAYFLLTGPATEGEEGTVVLSKRKLKQDVPLSRVQRVDGGGVYESGEEIKEAFNRLRFSDEDQD